MKLEVYWVVRHSESDDRHRAVAGPFCDEMEAYRAEERYQDSNILLRSYTTVMTQEIEVN
jgi:hypothetical protein